MTPAEFNGLSEVYGKKQQVEVDLVKASAYWSESLARTKRLPDFAHWMNPPKPARNLTGEEASQRLAEHEEDVAIALELRAKSKLKMAEEQRNDG